MGEPKVVVPIGPDYISTKQIPKVEVPGSQLDAVLSEVRAMRSEQAEAKGENANLFIQVFTRLDRLESQPPPTNGSLRAKVDTTSQENREQDAAIASVVIRLGTVEENQTKAAKERATTAEDVKAIKDAIVGTLTNKKVLFVGKILFAAAVAYSGLHGLKVLP